MSYLVLGYAAGLSLIAGYAALLAWRLRILEAEIETEPGPRRIE